LLILSRKGDAELIGIYQIALSDALDGKAAVSLGNASPVAVPASSRDSALIAIYPTTGPWRIARSSGTSSPHRRIPVLIGGELSFRVDDLGENPDFGIRLGLQGVNQKFHRVSF